jgi:hypothetical protein
MDYYAPRVKIRADASADLSDAYMQGTGRYDRLVIEWGYSQGAPGAGAEQEHARLDGIVRKAIAQGIVWGNYVDPRWNAYDDASDPVAWLKQVWPVRDALLEHYGERMQRPGERASRLASRFPLIYLFHRYALGAAVNVIGGARVPPALVGDGQTPLAVWPDGSQREALQLVLKALDPKELEIPASLWKLLAPAEPDDEDAERFTSSAGYLFANEDGARAVADIVAGGLLDAQRMQRLAVTSNLNAGTLSPSDVVGALVKAAFGARTAGPGPASGNSGANAANPIADAVRAQVADHLMLLAIDGSASPEVQAAALTAVMNVQKIVHADQSAAGRRLDHEITLFLNNPHENAPKLKPSGVPLGPPV